MKISGRIIIKAGQIHYLDNFLELLAKLKKNPQADNKIGFVVIDLEDMTTQEYQRKYYWGYVVQAIAEKAFDLDKDKAHLEMKRKFAYHQSSRVGHIPTNQRNRAILEYHVYNLREYVGIFRTMWNEYFTEPVLHKDLTFELDGYIQSITTMSKWEMATFILAVETWALDFLQIAIANDGPAYREEALLIGKKK
jgi:hypothetical protein